MKHYRFPAAYFIGWIRLCRAGSILGPQQQWLIKIQDKMFSEGNIFRLNNHIFIHPDWIKSGDKAILNNLTKNN